MKRLLIMIIAVVAAATAGAADTWNVDPDHSNVDFKIRHLMSKTSGTFNEFSGTVVTDFDNLDAASVEFTIDAASIDTRNDKRDKHLRSPDFFNVEKNPSITFKSTSITKAGEGTFDVTGDLTMNGVTRQVTLPVEFIGTMKDPWGNTRAGFSLETTLDRKEYGIEWNKALDAGGVLLGDEVEVEIDLQTMLAN